MGWPAFRGSTVTCAEICVSIDEKQVVAENGHESAEMSVQEKGVPAPSASLSRRFLMVSINRGYLAFEAGSVMRVTTVKELECVDDSTAYKTIDLAMRLNSPDSSTDPNAPVVVLTDRGTECRIQVGYVHGRLEIQPSQILPLPSQFCNGEGQWYRGMILFENSVAFILNSPWIVQEYVGANADRAQGDPDLFNGAVENIAQDGRIC